MIQRTWSGRQGTNEEATRQGARLPPRRALHPRGPLVALLTDFLHLYILIYPGNIRYGVKTLFPPPQPSVPKRSHLGAFFGALLEGALIMEGLYINSMAPPVMCEQFTLDLRVHSQQLDGFFSLFGSQYKVLLDSLGDLIDVTLLRCVCRDPMNCGFMIKFIYEQYLNLL